MSDRSFEIRTGNVDNIRQLMAGLFCPFRLTANSAAYDARLRHNSLGALSFTTLAYGNEVDIDVDERQSRFLMQIPIAGRFEVGAGRSAYRASATNAHIALPKTSFHLSCSADCAILVVGIDADDLELQVRTLAGENVALPAVVPDVLALTGAGATLGRYLDFLNAESCRADTQLRNVRGARPAVQTLFALLFQSFNIREPPLRPARAWYVKRAEAFMEQNLAASIGICDVVASSGVSMRTLYHGFRTCHGIPPMTWLKRQRLSRVHDELRAADAAQTNVTDVATRWGFFHLGRFASDYHAHFGLLPSDTLRRR